MIRFTSFQHRAQAAAALGVLAILAIVLAVTGIQVAHAYDAAVTACKQQGDCAAALSSFPDTLDPQWQWGLLDALVIAVPGLIGMFWGAPLAAREFETGTFRLAWTQGVTRVRWLAAKLAVAGAAAIAAGELFTLMVNWWSSPIHKANPGYNPFIPGSFHTGIAPAGYAAFAFALGVTAGLLIRRTLPAMAVTLVLYSAVIIAFPIWVRPHLIPPVQATSTLSRAAIANMPGAGAFNGHLSLAPGPGTAPPGTWVISSSPLTTPDGHASASEPAGPCGPPSPAAVQACNDYVESLHLRQTVTYQPASRYWTFQWIETAIYLALALALAGFSFWWINRNRSTAPGIRRLRTRQPALTTDALVLAEGAQFHRAAAGERVLGRDLDRLVEILAVEHVVADHELLGLGEGAVRDQRLPAANPDGGGVALVERAALEAHAPAVHLRHPGVDVHAALRVSGVNGRVEADDHQVPHGCLLRSFRFFPLPHRRTGIGRIDTRVR